MNDSKLAKDLLEAVKRESGTKPYDTTAQVLRVEGSTVWVHIDGGASETPCERTIDAREGDYVKVRISGGSAWLIGNTTAPPTDDTTALAVQKETQAYSKRIEDAEESADEAVKIANNTNQYFWHTETGNDTGAHITEIPKDEFIADPSNGGGNLLARSNGIAVRRGLTELAQFGTGIRIGQENEGHSIIYLDAGYSTEVTEVYKIISSNGAIVADIILDENNITPDMNARKSYSDDEYVIGSIGRVLTTLTTLDTVNIDIDDIDDYVGSGDVFTIFIYYDFTESAHRSGGLAGASYVSMDFVKGTSSIAQKTDTWANSGSEIYFSVDYDGAYSFDITVSAQKTNSSATYTLNVRSFRFKQFEYIVHGAMLPIQKYHGDIILNSENIGTTYLGLDIDKQADKDTAAISGNDKDLFNAIRNIGWYDDVIV